MTVNITIVFQLIHFLIAYVILNHLFFKYAIPVIKERDQVFQQLNDSIIQQQQNSEVLRAHVSEEWQRYQRALRGEIPSQEKLIATQAIIKPNSESTISNAQKENALIETIKQNLFKTILTINT